MSFTRFKPCYSKSDICCSTMAYNFNERLRRGKVDMSNATCVKNDQGQWRTTAFNHFNYVSLEDFGISEQ